MAVRREDIQLAGPSAPGFRLIARTQTDDHIVACEPTFERAMRTARYLAADGYTVTLQVDDPFFDDDLEVLVRKREP